MILVVMRLVLLVCHRCPQYKNVRKDNTSEEYTGRTWNRTRFA